MYLSGGEAVFECELIGLEAGCGILRYVINKPARVDSVSLEPGSVTYAFYWQDRPFNLYWWREPDQRTIAYYFNLADSVKLSRREFLWRDLVVDILILPDGRLFVLDRDELPSGLDSHLRAYIESAQTLVVDSHASLVAEAERVLAEFSSG